MVGAAAWLLAALGFAGPLVYAVLLASRSILPRRPAGAPVPHSPFLPGSIQ
jgi:hypothetical protein